MPASWPIISKELRTHRSDKAPVRRLLLLPQSHLALVWDMKAPRLYDSIRVPRWSLKVFRSADNRGAKLFGDESAEHV
jgi:hypothetical protein